MSKINQKLRKEVQKKIQEVLKPTYFSEIPLDAIIDTLASSGLVLLQEDHTEWSGFLLGRNAHVLFRLGFVDSMKEQNGFLFYDVIDNAGLSLSWYKDEQRKNIEVTGYLS